jgi:hypothetical protein
VAPAPAPSPGGGVMGAIEHRCESTFLRTGMDTGAGRAHCDQPAVAEVHTPEGWVYYLCRPCALVARGLAGWSTGEGK